MRQFLILALLLCCVSGSDASRRRALLMQQDVSAGGGSNPPASPLVNQNFEGAGYDNSETWTELAGTPDEDYTGVALRGSQSLQLAAGDFANVMTQFTLSATKTEVWGFLEFQIVDDRASVLVRLEDSGFATLFEIARSGANITVTAGGAAETGATTVSVGTHYYLWFHYLQGSGSDAVGDFHISTTNIKPGSADATDSNGTSTGAVKYFDLLWSAAMTTGEVVVDHVYLDDEEILSNP